MASYFDSVYSSRRSRLLTIFCSIKKREKYTINTEWKDWKKVLEELAAWMTFSACLWVVAAQEEVPRERLR